MGNCKAKDAEEGGAGHDVEDTPPRPATAKTAPAAGEPTKFVVSSKANKIPAEPAGNTQAKEPDYTQLLQVVNVKDTCVLIPSIGLRVCKEDVPGQNPVPMLRTKAGMKVAAAVHTHLQSGPGWSPALLAEAGKCEAYVHKDTVTLSLGPDVPAVQYLCPGPNFTGPESNPEAVPGMLGVQLSPSAKQTGLKFSVLPMESPAESTAQPPNEPAAAAMPEQPAESAAASKPKPKSSEDLEKLRAKFHELGVMLDNNKDGYIQPEELSMMGRELEGLAEGSPEWDKLLEMHIIDRDKGGRLSVEEFVLMCLDNTEDFWEAGQDALAVAQKEIELLKQRRKLSVDPVASVAFRRRQSGRPAPTDMSPISQSPSREPLSAADVADAVVQS